MAKAKTWTTFFEYLKERGLQGTELVISDAHKGLVSAIKIHQRKLAKISSLPKNIFTTIPKNSKSFREAVKGIFKFTECGVRRLKSIDS